MSTNKTARSSAKSPTAGAGPTSPRRTEGYERAVQRFKTAVEQLHGGRVAEALEAFRGVAKDNNDEYALAERALAYATVCERKLAGAAAGPTTVEEFYREGVAAANAGRLDEALSHIEQAAARNPADPSILYARACIWALRGAADKAAQDLRRAVGIDPRLRFQAINDPDFESIRDEAAFIDVIEPTPAGA